MSVRRLCPICKYPYPMHSGMCFQFFQLQDQIERIEPPVGKCKPAPKPRLNEPVIYEESDE